MPSARMGVAAVLLGTMAAPWAGQARTPAVQTGASSVRARPTFRSATEIVALQVTVLDRRGQYVSDLRPEDFAVYEEGVPQPVTLFTTASAPLDLMLLLDTSSSMAQHMVVVQEAAINFVRTLRADDRAAVTFFSDRVLTAQPLTDSQPLLEEAIRRGLFGGGTRLHEALYVSLRALERSRRTDPAIRRQALIVLSDGDDTSQTTHVPFEDVLDLARRSAVTIFTIVPASDATWDSFARRRREAALRMHTLAQEAGGRSFTPSRIEDLAGTYQQIADELSRQYWLAYMPRPSAGGFRRISVRVPERPTLVARTRSGYFSGGAGARLPQGAARRPSGP